MWRAPGPVCARKPEFCSVTYGAGGFENAGRHLHHGSRDIQNEQVGAAPRTLRNRRHAMKVPRRNGSPKRHEAGVPHRRLAAAIPLQRAAGLRGEFPSTPAIWWLFVRQEFGAIWFSHRSGCLS